MSRETDPEPLSHDCRLSIFSREHQYFVVSSYSTFRRFTPRVEIVVFCVHVVIKSQARLQHLLSKILLDEAEEVQRIYANDLQHAVRRQTSVRHDLCYGVQVQRTAYNAKVQVKHQETKTGQAHDSHMSIRATTPDTNTKNQNCSTKTCRRLLPSMIHAAYTV